MIRRPPRSTLSSSSAASDVYKRQHMYHWKENRALTNRERARLQTFPDSFVFSGSKESVRRQVGMAVPPRGVQVVFEAILKTFANIEYKSVQPNITPVLQGAVQS